MTKEDIISFVNANPVCYLATVEGNAPHVRAMGMYKADNRGILLQTGAIKGMYNELIQNPKIELCFNGGEKVVRISGKAEFLEDQNLKEEIVKSRPFLKPLVNAQGYDVIKVFRVANAIATVWTMAANLEPMEFVKL